MRPPNENAPAAAAARGADTQRNTIPVDTTPAKVTPQREAPEYHCSRRRFLVWAVMAGYVKPERMTERVVAEIEAAQP